MSRGVLGIELDAPFKLGPLAVVDLALGLPNIRFPVDLSGGVARFRHRRGALLRIEIEAGAAALASWAAPRLRGLLAESAPEVVLAPFDAGLSVGLRSGRAALSFDVIVAPIEGDLRLIADRARGLGISAPPHALAMRALDAVAAPFGRVARGAVVIAEAAAQLGRHVLPAAGARAPSAAGVRWEPPQVDAGEREGGPVRLVLAARAGASPPALSDRLLRALELGELCGDADEAAYRGDLDAARRLYLAALERAPRHPEIAQRAAWIDAIAGDRAEAALSTIVEAMPAAFAGVLGGLLLAAVGDEDGGRVAYTRAAQAEPHGALAALTWLEAARLAPGLAERLDALDGAVARAPALDLARWERLAARLDLADLRGARADAEHLEAAARGAEAKHAVWRRAADAFLARGHVAESGALFERALRYAPESVEAVTGLARSLRAAGQDRRAVDLFARAVALASRAGVAAHAAEIELARSLAEVAGDRPAAIARARAIPPGLAESAEARFLEGRWRAEIGDLAGASLAFGRLRDAIELEVKPGVDRAAALAAMLSEAASIEENDRGDVHAAQRDLGLALRLRPKDASIAARFRRVAAMVARSAPAVVAPVARVPAPAPVHVEIDAAPEATVDESVPPSAPAAAPVVAAPIERDEAEDEALAQELTDRLRADPRDHAVAMELADALGRLGKSLDLLALLSARMEEGDEEERREVAPRRRAVLLALAQEARAEGRASEAELYEMMAESGEG